MDGAESSVTDWRETLGPDRPQRRNRPAVSPSRAAMYVGRAWARPSGLDRVVAGSMAPAAASRYSYIPTSKEPRSGLLPPSALVWKVNHSGGPSSGPLADWRVGALAGA